MATKLFFDTEFTGLHKDTTLISIGIVSENDRVFYAELVDYDKEQVNPWIGEHVIKYLFLNDNNQTQFANKYFVKTTYHGLKKYLGDWLRSFNGPVEMWSDCLAYDWVLFNDIFGTAFDIPKNVYYIPFDISTYFKLKDIDPDINREEFVKDRIDSIEKTCSKLGAPKTKHNSLWDALVIRECYTKLTNES